MPANPVPHMKAEEFRELGRRMVDWIADYWEQVEQYPVLSVVNPGDVKQSLPASAPQRTADPKGEWDAIFRDLSDVILPGITHWQSPNFYGYFPANASGPAVLGELLSAGLGVQGMLWATSPACTELEERVLDWLVGALALPEGWKSDQGGAGVIQGTASEAVLVAMVAARERARLDGWREGVPLVVYASSQAHSSITKAAMIAGIASGPDDRQHVRLIGADASLAMDVEELERAMLEDIQAGRWPLFVCATLGTTSTTAFDPVRRVAQACARVTLRAGQLVWVHVDAAHAGSACVCPEFRWMLDGVEFADSFCFNPHKWLLTNFDCDCFWTRDKQALTNALSITPEYLRTAAADAGRVTDLRDMQIPLGRRFRSLKLWFVLRHYGVEGLQAYIREHVRLAAMFESLVRADGRFEVVGERKLNLVCFRLKGEGPDADARNRALLDAINRSGRAFLTHTVVGVEGRQKFVLRMAIGAVQTREEHVQRAWELIRSLVP